MCCLNCHKNGFVHDFYNKILKNSSAAITATTSIIFVLTMKNSGYVFLRSTFLNGGKFSWLVHKNLLKHTTKLEYSRYLQPQQKQEAHIPW